MGRKILTFFHKKSFLNWAYATSSNALLVFPSTLLFICFILQPTPQTVENSGPITPEDDADDGPPPPPIATRPDKTKSIVSIHCNSD